MTSRFFERLLEIALGAWRETCAGASETGALELAFNGLARTSRRQALAGG